MFVFVLFRLLYSCVINHLNPSIVIVTFTARTGSFPSSRVTAPSNTLSPTAGGVGDEQLQFLYQQLDDKDDEINKQAQTIARLRQQVEEQDEIINTLRKEREGQLKEITNLQV